MLSSGLKSRGTRSRRYQPWRRRTINGVDKWRPSRDTQRGKPRTSPCPTTHCARSLNLPQQGVGTRVYHKRVAQAWQSHAASGNPKESASIRAGMSQLATQLLSLVLCARSRATEMQRKASAHLRANRAMFNGLTSRICPKRRAEGQQDGCIFRARSVRKKRTHGCGNPYREKHIREAGWACPNPCGVPCGIRADEACQKPCSVPKRTTADVSPLPPRSGKPDRRASTPSTLRRCTDDWRAYSPQGERPRRRCIVRS